MDKFLTEIKDGLVDAAKFVIDAPATLPKIIKLCDDAKQDASTVIPDLTKLVSDVENIVVTSGQDGASFLAASKLLWPSILAAISAGGTNITLDLSILADVKPAIADAKGFENTIPLFEQLFTDWTPLASSINADLAQLKSDAEAIV